MSAVQSMTGHGGWPLNVFLTPDGTPFYGGTYFPPDDRMECLAFPEGAGSGRQRIPGAARRSRRTRTRSASCCGERRKSCPSPMSSTRDSCRGLRAARPVLRCPKRRIRWSPKVSAASRARVLAAAGQARRRPARSNHGAADARPHGRRRYLRPVGGGFHRYAVDAIWLVPHFEKMLYDNAQLASSILPATRRTATTGTGRWPRRRLTSSRAS